MIRLEKLQSRSEMKGVGNVCGDSLILDGYEFHFQFFF